jgi:hypothetical protein
MTRKSSLILSIFTLALCSIKAQVQVEIKNPTALQRQEVVSIDAKGLGFDASQGVVVKDAFGIERTSQLTNDGKLLLDVHVRPNAKTVYIVQPGQPANVLPSVGGRQYPERMDDLAFENDRIGFRLYGPALQRSGEKGFGHDVWIKRTPELILEELYKNNPRLSFHLDYGKGLDCYGVGPTLGCGTPALIKDGKIVYPWCYETYKIIENGPLRFMVQVDFPKTKDGVTEHRLLTLDKGSNFCEAKVWYDGIKQTVDVAAGLVIRPTDTTTVVIGDAYVQYADPTTDPERHQYQIYVALLFPDTPVNIVQQENHALGIKKGYKGEPFHYYFGAAWSEYDVRSQSEWQQRIDNFMQVKQHPLEITLQKQQ